MDVQTLNPVQLPRGRSPGARRGSGARRCHDRGHGHAGSARTRRLGGQGGSGARRARRRHRGVPAARSGDPGRSSTGTMAIAAAYGEEIADVRRLCARPPRWANARRSTSSSGCRALRRWRAEFVDAAGGRITVLDTRKTTPTLRALEKYAVTAGGATNHRMGLFDAVLIKDNHVRLAGGVEAAVALVAGAAAPDCRSRSRRRAWRRSTRRSTPAPTSCWPTTCRSRTSAKRCGARGAARRSRSPAASRSSASPELAATGADFVSVGALTHSAPAVDISFEIEPSEPLRRMAHQSEDLPADLAEALDARRRSVRPSRLAACAISRAIGSTNDVAATLAAAGRRARAPS